jgi:hypothetical protein
VPAAAVIPAPVAYIKVVAVKTLVVELRAWRDGPPYGVYYPAGPYLLVRPHALYWVWGGTRNFTLRKLECSKQANARIH